MSESISEIIASEERLVNEAAEALPHQFSSCTFSLGYIRQAVYLCLTCDKQRGICSACSIACHTDHEQVELFPKRHFRCDCPTSAVEQPCSLHKTWEENSENTYGQNFRGIFCRCGRPYDAKQERETMIQCLACEDWFHESCLNLRERPISREPTPARPSEPSKLNSGSSEQSAEPDNVASEASSSGLPPPLLTDLDYDTLICRACILSNSTLRHWAGAEGAIMVTRDDVDAPWTTIGGPSEDLEVEAEASSESSTRRSLSESEKEQANAVGSKRALEAMSSDLSEETRMKRPRTEGKTNAPLTHVETIQTPCIAPQQPQIASIILNHVSSEPPNYGLGAGDVFFTEGWRARWCKCDKCVVPLRTQPYLLEEEETYEPPEDPDSGTSLEELGMRALLSLPRDRAIDGLRAFNEMRDDLLSYLRPFAQEGKVVNEADVRAFFERKQEERRAHTEVRYV